MVVFLVASGLGFASTHDGGSATSSASASRSAQAGSAAVSSTASDGSPTAQPESSAETQSRTADKSAAQLAPTGSKLATVPTAPPKTLGTLLLPDGVTEARVNVIFEVYGWAPDGPDGDRRLVVSVLNSKPVDANANPQDLTGQNAVFSLGAYKGRPVREGGRYEGTVDVRSDDGGRGLMYLVSSKLQ
jgi:hypothetical protein